MPTCGIEVLGVRVDEEAAAFVLVDAEGLLLKVGVAAPALSDVDPDAEMLRRANNDFSDLTSCWMSLSEDV